MKIKNYVFLLSMFTSWMSLAGGFSLPTYTLNYASVGGVDSRIVGRTIYINIKDAAKSATALGLNFQTNPYSGSTFSLTGVGTITSGSIQNYKANPELSVIFSNGKVLKYNVKISKDATPAEVILPSSNANIRTDYFTVSTIFGYGQPTIENTNCIVGYNKVTCAIPANLSVTSLYFTGFSEDGNTTVSGSGIDVTSNGQFTATSLVSVNEVTTITATAEDGTVKNYAISFVESKTLFGNKIVNFYASGINAGLNESPKSISIYRDANSPSETTFNFKFSEGASLSVSGGNTSSISFDNNNYDYPYSFTLSLPSTNFDVIVTSKDGAQSIYPVNIIDIFNEPNLPNASAPLDINFLEIAGIRSNKIGNELFFNFPYNYAPLINGAGIYTYVNLSQTQGGGNAGRVSQVGNVAVGNPGVGNVGVSIDGVYFDQNGSSQTYVNWTTSPHTLEIYTVTGNGNLVVKTYTIKTKIDPKPSYIVGSQTANGLLTANEISQFYVQFENIKYYGTLTGNTFIVNVPSNYQINDVTASISYSSKAIASVPGIFVRDQNYFYYDFSNPVPCVIFAEDGTPRSYSLVVTNTAPKFTGDNTCGLISDGSLNDDTYFNLDNAYDNATVIGNNIKVDVPFGTNLSKIKLTLNSSGTFLKILNYGVFGNNVDNLLVDLTTPLTVTSIADNGVTSKTYILAVNSILPTSANVDLYFNTSSNVVKVVKTGDSFKLLYKAGQDFTQCSPTFYTYSSYSNVSVLGVRQYSNNTKVNLSNPVIYTVQAQSGAMKTYTVTAATFDVNAPVTLNTDKSIIAVFVENSIAVKPGFENEVEATTFNGSFSGTNIYLSVLGNNTGAAFSTYISGRYVDGFPLKSILVNGFPFNNRGVFDFAKPLKITAVAQDNTTLDYMVYVTYTVNGVASISKVPVLTVTAFNASKTYGEANPAFTGSVVGLLNGDNVSVGYYLNGNTIIPSVTGAALVNYYLVTVGGILTVNKATLAVTAFNASKTYGEANPVFTGTVVGLLNGDNVAVSYYLNGSSIIPSVSGSSLSNYTIVTVGGILTVNKANQTIVGFVIPNPSTVSGKAFALNASVTSGLTIDYASSNTAVASISGTSITFLKAGVVTITATQVGNANYNATSISLTTNVITVAGLPTGISETNTEIGIVSIYPNPSAGQFTISGAEGVVVYDLIGNVVVASKSQTFFIDFKGLFIAVANTAKGKKYIKLVVE